MALLINVEWGAKPEFEHVQQLIWAEQGRNNKGISRSWTRPDTNAVLLTSNATGVKISPDAGVTPPALVIVQGSPAGGGLSGTYPNPSLTGSPTFTAVTTDTLTVNTTLTSNGNTTLGNAAGDTVTVNGTTTFTTNTTIGDGSGDVITVNGTTTVTAPATFSSGVLMSAAHSLTGVITPAQITANQNDYAPSGYDTTRTMRLSSDAARNITGIAFFTGAEGRMLAIYNVGANNITLVHESALSTAANRFLLRGSVNLTIGPNASVDLWYDIVSSRWRYGLS